MFCFKKMATIIKEGFAFKRTFLRFFYRKVYLMLYDNGDLVVYSGRRIVNNINVKDYCFLQTNDHFSSNPAKSKFYFKLSTNGTNLHLYVRQIQDRRLWKEAIEVTSRLSNIKMDMFQVLHSITSGSFGKVLICKTKTDDVVSIKQINKKNGVTLREGYLMTEFRHPFVMNAVELFIDNNQFHIVMPFAIGGNLQKLLSRKGSLTEDEARFYTAEMVLAIGYLHHLNIAHHDVKPANILIMGNGHIRLTDFGLSTERMHADAVFSICCGTRSYMAPEVFRSNTHTRSVDWWATGVVLFQMISGRLPFELVRDVGTIDPMETLTTRLSIEIKNLLHGLLESNPKIRLANELEIQEHPFFQGIIWKEVFEQRLTPPIVPSTVSVWDITYL